jgi:hypothetical protein
MCCNLVNRNDKTIITAVFNGCLMDENRNDSMESNVIIIAKDRDVQKDERKNRKHTKIMDDARSTGMKETSRNKKVFINVNMTLRKKISFRISQINYRIQHSK